VSKEIRILFGFATPRFVIGLKVMRHFLVQSEVITKELCQLAHASIVSCRLHLIGCSFDSFIITGLYVSFAVRQSNYFGFGFFQTQLNRMNTALSGDK